MNGITFQSKKLYIPLITGIGVIALTCLFMFDPMQYSWMPKCLFKTVTGLDCPGCGSSRALHALLHGHLREALSYNYFLVVGIGYATCVFAVTRIKSLRYLRKRIAGTGTAYVFIVLFFAWWIIRNLEWFKNAL